MSEKIYLMKKGSDYKYITNSKRKFWMEKGYHVIREVKNV